ncbi:MAG: prepilin-type N-terminal cleavage/methylation domain-containing protein [Smithella sp.]|nr:prepilin-type N-terminal cleavage/methylation domain-containing protein [Syntrophaceae bacterium]NTW77811.1 prepilin-type N-terminal cleavage/methylation domain-containing protein [Syntrophaceae bacterium]
MNQRGFTLLELMIAIALLAVIVGLMTGTLSMAYKTVEKGERKIESLERKKIVFSLMESQIQSAFSSSYDDQGEKKSRFIGEKDNLAFASNYSIWHGAGGNSLVRYFIKTTDQGRDVLYVEEQVLGTDTANEARLTKDYDSITFEYYLENSLEEAKWVDRWPEEEKKLPRKIRICFADGMDKKILTANVFVMENSARAMSDAQSNEKMNP